MHSRSLFLRLTLLLAAAFVALPAQGSYERARERDVEYFEHSEHSQRAEEAKHERLKRKPKRHDRYPQWPSFIQWTSSIDDVLRPGDELRLDWSFQPDAPEMEGVFEWEAYLSIDGGKSYLVRLTPDMGLDVRTVLWRVPDLQAPEVVLFLHVGGRGFEKIFELPRRFAIGGDLSPARYLAPRSLEETEQELSPYRPVLDGAVAFQAASALRAPGAGQDGPRFEGPGAPALLANLKPERDPSPESTIAHGHAWRENERRLAAARSRTKAPTVRHLLKLHSRLNE
jgi:hypothetical protein